MISKDALRVKMKAVSKRTCKNAYDEVLFQEGKAYEIVDIDSKRIWVLNELHTETAFREARFAESFDIQ